MITDIALQNKYKKLLPNLDEYVARLYLGSEAESLVVSQFKNVW